MEGMVRLSFYLFAAASISVAAAWVSYVVYAVGVIRVKRTAVATNTGITMSGPTAEFGPPSASAGRFGTLFGWFAVVFSGLAVLTRTIASHRGPYSNMFEFSLAFVFVVTLAYMLFERFYQVKQLGAIVMTIALGMCLYLWSLPPKMREVDALNPALQNRPLMTVHVSAAILAYATFAVSFAAAVLFLIQIRKNVSWLPSAEMLDDIGYRAVTVGFPCLRLCSSLARSGRIRPGARIGHGTRKKPLLSSPGSSMASTCTHARCADGAGSGAPSS
ncbi:MAG: cytochrome c biogenesis protein CcsA [Thermomicrobiales bacterium]